MSTPSSFDASVDPRPPAAARARLAHLEGKRDLLMTLHRKKTGELAKVMEYLGMADAVEQALDQLSAQLFGRLVRILEEKLSLALQEVLEQPLALKVTRAYKRGVATLGFHVERHGQPEDIMQGQGGSVVNILSVGLRLLALTTLDAARHRRLLVLDEPDCWLRPELVPRLVQIIHEAGRALGFQVLLISHHDVSAFERFQGIGVCVVGEEHCSGGCQ